VQLLDRAAETFAILAGPVRLRILHAVCDRERPVSEIVTIVGQSQTNVSQHLALMYRAGVLRRRRDGTQVFYAIADPKVVSVCRLMCTMVASESDDGGGLEPEPARRRGRQPGAARSARESR
jgi:DNA-binding transcriptional ArsR family regulator